MPKPKVVTLKPGDGRTITREVDPARDQAWREICRRLMSARAQLTCAQRTIHHSDSVNTDDEVLFAGHSLGDICDALEELHDLLDRFDSAHISKVKVQGVES